MFYLLWLDKGANKGEDSVSSHGHIGEVGHHLMSNDVKKFETHVKTHEHVGEVSHHLMSNNVKNSET